MHVMLHNWDPKLFPEVLIHH
ncbi:hypothetical protein Golax_024102 [Gossypium laxum]|uniref:Uncharacterized protein n=1 Tax=Gossypium laxum TaxID=34288 RepID=A0A7J8ZBN6_9ROSI|nr:hypothetical protein [Gossypium laxum]